MLERMTCLETRGMIVQREDVCGTPKELWEALQMRLAEDSSGDTHLRRW